MKRLLFVFLLSGCAQSGVSPDECKSEQEPDCLTDTECLEYAIEQDWPEECWP